MFAHTFHGRQGWSAAHRCRTDSAFALNQGVRGIYTDPRTLEDVVQFFDGSEAHLCLDDTIRVFTSRESNGYRVEITAPHIGGPREARPQGSIFHDYVITRGGEVYQTLRQMLSSQYRVTDAENLCYQINFWFSHIEGAPRVRVIDMECDIRSRRYILVFQDSSYCAFEY